MSSIGRPARLTVLAGETRETGRSRPVRVHHVDLVAAVPVAAERNSRRGSRNLRARLERHARSRRLVGTAGGEHRREDEWERNPHADHGTSLLKILRTELRRRAVMALPAATLSTSLTQLSLDSTSLSPALPTPLAVAGFTVESPLVGGTSVKRRWPRGREVLRRATGQPRLSRAIRV